MGDPVLTGAIDTQRGILHFKQNWGGCGPGSIITRDSQRFHSRTKPSRTQSLPKPCRCLQSLSEPSVASRRFKRLTKPSIAFQKTAEGYNALQSLPTPSMVTRNFQNLLGSSSATQSLPTPPEPSGTYQHLHSLTKPPRAFHHLPRPP